MKYINFNNAGSSFVKNQTLKIIKDFLEFENNPGILKHKSFFKSLDKSTSSHFLFTKAYFELSLYSSTSSPKGIQ